MALILSPPVLHRPLGWSVALITGRRQRLRIGCWDRSPCDLGHKLHGCRQRRGKPPQIQRSGWAVLAAGALVASILAVGAAPAAAGKQQPDARSTWLACVGAAKAGHGLTDMSMSSAHYHDIH